MAMEVSSTSSNATSLLTASDESEANIHTVEPSDPPETLSITNDNNSDKLKLSSGAGDCDIDTVSLPYGPIVSPHFYPSHSGAYSKDVRDIVRSKRGTCHRLIQNMVARVNMKYDSKAVHGSSGLYNLGNTCYMNSGLQSLFSCAPLVKFFAETYTHDENSRHTLTYHLYVLLCKVWSGQFSVVHPRTFKDFLGLYHSQFEDYRQHDCQEFLAFLLDTLHEQLNVSPQSNNLCPVASILDKDREASEVPPVSPVASTSASGMETLKSEETLVESSLTLPGIEGMSKTCNEDEHFVDSSKAKEDRVDFAIVSATSSSPQSCDESSESDKTSSPECCHFEVESSTRPSVGSGDEVIMSSSMEGNSRASRDSELVEKSDCDYISSSCPALRRYTSRSNLDDVTSSDMGLAVKPSLKRVSSDSGVTASGLVFLSEDSNQSSVSVHSTDSEQSSAFKRLKIDSVEINKNSNSNNNSQKDFVSSSSDCKSENPLKARNEKLDCIIKCNEVTPSSSACVSSSLHKTVNISGNGVPFNQVDALPSVLEISEGDKDMPDLEDFYRKETKTLNTNVLVTDHAQEITCDSEKFAKVDNRNRPPSKEINLLQEAFGDEDKVDKVLISQHFGLKDTNLLAQASSSVKSSKSNSKALNNSFEEGALTCSTLTKLGSSVEVMEDKALSPLKLVADGGAVGKLDEEEKNVQMQAYSKFNTTPSRSNIRTDLIDTIPAEKSLDGDEAEEEESSDEEVVEKTSHCSGVDDCSSIPNCLRHCSPSEIAMANQAWCDYKAKNDSIVVSTFQGQFRSTVVCSECNHISVTYEPFMYLSLPIPHALEQQLCITYISANKPPVRYLLNLFKTDKIGTAKKKLKEKLCENEGDIIMAEMLDFHVSRILDDNVLLKYANTANRKIYAFEVINAMAVINSVNDEPFSDQLLNNHDENSSVLREGLCLASSSREETGVSLLRRSDSEISNHSFDSITVNSPTSRDAMDLGFSDAEMCESSSAQDIGLPSSYFHEERRDEDDDICQSTSDEADFHFKTNSNSKSISGTTCLSWQIVKEAKGVDSTNIHASSAGGLSSPSCFQEDHATVSSNFWVNESSCSGCASIDNSALPQVTEISESRLSPSRGDCGDAAEIARETIKDSECVSEDGTVMEVEDSKKETGSRSCPSPEMFVCQSDQSNVLAQAADRLSEDPRLSGEDPGSYFLQSSQFDSLGPVCQTDDSSQMVDTSCSEDAPIMGAESHCVTGSWPVFDPLNEESSGVVGPNPSSDIVSTSTQMTPTGKGEGVHSSIPMTADQWRSCAICLEDLPSSQLLTHVNCDGIFCQNCLDMSVKHTPDVSAYCCPICLQPASIYEDFIHLPSSSNDTKSNVRMLPICITYRHSMADNTGASSLQLVGHPNIIQLPSIINGEALYALIDRMLCRPVFTYSLMLTDGQGLSCSRCPYASHCTGCEISREGDLSLHPSDCLTVHSSEMLSPDEVSEMGHVYDDVSLEGLRSSEPTTLMDCFRAFTQSEILDEHNPWYCPQCKRNQCAKKTMTVWRYPDSLIIHLKRFVYQDLSSTKVDTKVTFPHEAMDVRGFLSGPSSSSLLYNLYSVVCHFGGASAGHYTSFTKHPLTSQWYYYNDETVSPQIPSENEFTSGYVLFYQRQGTQVEFSPPQYNSSLEDSSSDGGVSVSNTSATPFNSQAKIATSSSMALVPFEPPVTSSSSPSVPAKKSNDDSEEADDDYDYERRCSPFCDYDSLTVHFGADFPDVEDC